MKKKLAISSFIFSVVLSILIWAWFFELIYSFNRWLEQYQIIIAWSLNRTIYTIGLGTIPVLGYLSLFITKKISILNYLMQILNIILGLLVTFIIAYLLAIKIGEPPSILLPDYITYEPFDGYWNLVLFAGLTFYFGSLLAWVKVKKRKAL